MPLTLRNGHRIHALTAITIWDGFLELREADIGAAFELVFACRDQNHVVPPGYRGSLRGWAMVQEFAPDGHATIHDDVRAVVLSGVEGDDEHMVLMNPWIIPGSQEEGT